MNKMGGLRRPSRQTTHGRTCSSLLQGYPYENESQPTSALGSMENRHYTVEQRGASKLRVSGNRLRQLYFHQDGIKGGRVAHVGKFF